MKASFVDLRKKSVQILRALYRGEEVTVHYRGRPKAVMQPIASEGAPAARARTIPRSACGPNGRT